MDERLEELDKERAAFEDECASVSQTLDERIDQVCLPSPASVHEDLWLSEYACDISCRYVHTSWVPLCDRPRLSCEPYGQPIKVKSAGACNCLVICGNVLHIGGRGRRTGEAHQG